MKVNKKIALGGGAAVVVIAVTVGLVAWGASGSGTTATTTTQGPAATSAVAAPPATGGGDGFGMPTTDFIGRKVVHPNDARGQVLPQHDPGQRVECDLPDKQPTSPGGVQIQDTFGLPTLFSTTDGPTRFDGDIPVGYRHSPQGAALAAAALFTKTFDDPARMLHALVTLGNGSSAANAKAEAEAKKVAGVQSNAVMKSGVLAPAAFRVLSCDKDFVAVELASPIPLDENGQRLAQPQWYGTRMNVAWRDGDWKILELPQGVQHQIYTSLEGWTQWDYN